MKGSELRPIAAALTAAILWGLWWIPIRYLEVLGLDGIWAGLAMNVAAALVLIPVVLFGKGFVRMSPTALLGALLIGVAITGYATAVTYTDVVRAVLLFYLAPAWSTIIECAMMGRKWNWRSLVALACSFLGMFLILGGNFGEAGIGPGEIQALLAGMAWSVGAAAIFSDSRVSAAQMSLTAIVGACIVALAAGAFVAPPDLSSVMASVPAALASGILYLLPMVAITLWSARLLAPALMSFLLSAEIISGVGSSALLLEEKFGLVEILGTVFIALGAVTEVLVPDRTVKGRVNHDQGPKA